MKLATVLALVMLVILAAPVLLHAAPPPPEQQNWKWETVGPRTDYMMYSIILDYDARLTAFKKGEIDTLFIQPARVGEVKDDPNIYLLTYRTFNLQFLGINMRQYPWNYTAIRKAIAHLIDKEWIITNVFNGFGVPVDSPIPPAFGDWSNPNVPSYPYSKEMAKKVLLDAGFKYDPAANKWYDPRGNPLGDIIIQIPPQEQAPWLWQEAQRIVQDAQSIGLPVKIETIEFQALVSQIYSKTFKAFILYLGWGRIPTLAYELFRTGGSWNFWGLSDPEIDDLLQKFYFTTDIQAAKQALWKVQEKVANILPYIPIYMGIASVGFRTDIAGIVLNKPLGGQSYLTTLNVHHIGTPFGGTYRLALGSDPRTLNPFVAISGDELAVIGQVYESLFIADPEQVSSDFPWLAKSWKIESAKIGKSNVTKITFYLANNVTWQDGVKFTARDVNFTWYFIKVNKPRQGYSKAIENLIKTEIPDDYTIIAYVNGTSWAYLYDLNVLIVPAHIWGNTTLLESAGGWEKFDPSKVPHPTVKGLTCMVGTGPFIFADRKKGEYILLRWNPNYWKRHPQKTIAAQITAPESVLEGQPLLVKVSVTDYQGKPLPNATVTVSLVSGGKVVKQASAVHIGNGVYNATINTSGLGGSFDLSVSVEAEIAGAKFARTLSTTVSVRPAWEQYLPAIVLAIVVVAVIAAVLLVLRKKARAPPPQQAQEQSQEKSG